MSVGIEKGGAGLQPGTGRRPDQGMSRKKWKLALIGLIGVYLALSGYSIATSYPSHGARPGSASGAGSTPRRTAGGQSSAGVTTPAPGAAGGGTAPPSPRPAPAQPLAVMSIVAFGPDGPADGDNPGTVSRILDVSTDQPWYSQWYTTPWFGNLRQGTGLLLDMGQTVTVRDIQLLLGSEPGADIQVRLGNSPVVDLPTVARVSGAPGGAIRLRTRSARGRYLLIWFTRLPPDGLGHYQVSVYDVTVDGVG